MKAQRPLVHRAAECVKVLGRQRLERLRAAAPALVIATLAAGIGWAVAHELIGPRGAFFAPIAAVITVGLTAGHRIHRGIELSVGVALGIAVADVLVLLVGSGTVQLMGIVLLAMALAVVIGGSPLFVTQSAVSAILVVTLQPPTDGLSFHRSGAALIGCGVALALTFFVFPVNPLALMRREAAPVLRELAATLRQVAAALQSRDRRVASAALAAARSADAGVARLNEALEIGREAAVVAPARRGERTSLEAYAATGMGLDLVVRNVRVLARGAIRAIDTGDEVPPQAVNAILRLAEAVEALQAWLADPQGAPRVRDAAVGAAREATEALRHTSNLSASVIVAQVRSAAVDVLRSIGMSPAEARELVRGAPAAASS